MEIFMVGGAVRDMLLGLPVVDRDWVVVGSTPEELVALGFLPVGKDFPVFLHPKTKEEYALARTERKTARGYRGFVVHAAPDVTLNEDLTRRDLTINSIAACALIDWATGLFGTDFDSDISALIDPHGGQRDLQNKVLRHITGAFAEDPVRILRVARFAARFTDFNVAPETMQLMSRMVATGEADALVAERVWQELGNGLMQAKPSRMMQVLEQCGALKKLLPELTWSANAGAAIDRAAAVNAQLSVRFACMVASSLSGLHMPELLEALSSAQFDSNRSNKQLESDPNLIQLASDPNLIFNSDLTNLFSPAVAVIAGLCERLRVPVDCRELASVVVRERAHITTSAALDAGGLVRLLERCDAFRRPQRFALVTQACACLGNAGHNRGQGQPHERHNSQGFGTSLDEHAGQRLLDAMVAAQTIDTEKIAADTAASCAAGNNKGEAIAQAIHAARVGAVAALEAAGGSSSTAASATAKAAKSPTR